MDIELTLQVSDWLYQEADLLDQGRFQDWLKLMDPDVHYYAPVRQNLYQNSLDSEMRIFEENLRTLTLRVERLYTEFAWAESPPSRTRHNITNIRVRSEADGVVAAQSNFIFVRSRGEDAASDVLSGQREDTLRRTADGFMLLERRIVLDQSVLAVKNVAFFL
ncbi:aromatic-ring-hydroxylating dioxygenase subunit beta [Sulfobacillus harzensis]|uniref:3-phenylpropionate/cinnamic acid dioxygenase subunit beta n=1 Tax=Sulfobacillus harzensis TaxID=2729629 RepID=A0A7Y0L3N8_9FIRM|nr:3-phenylpropionate/cinnamic acid dioxygenase subunit beta [Sulfobacillus harzensis]NMP22737.1 3-phenylpropionate/cinnamic acid dioxygenase subunit beta [Sulfobacillus harzensis]